VAYVQLRPGKVIDEQTLLAFAQTQIGERAAWPKAVHRMDALPLTAVGKIFKPALREIETARVVREALAAVGVDAAIAIATDPRRGMVAHVEVAPAEADRARVALSGYFFAAEVTLRNNIE